MTVSAFLLLVESISIASRLTLLELNKALTEHRIDPVYVEELYSLTKQDIRIKKNETEQDKYGA